MAETKNLRPPSFCPKCGFDNIVPIVYGMPTEEAWDRSKEGEIKLGGCCISDDAPQWHCKNCSHKWGRNTVLESFRP